MQGFPENQTLKKLQTHPRRRGVLMMIRGDGFEPSYPNVLFSETPFSVVNPQAVAPGPKLLQRCSVTLSSLLRRRRVGTLLQRCSVIVAQQESGTSRPSLPRISDSVLLVFPDLCKGRRGSWAHWRQCSRMANISVPGLDPIIVHFVVASPGPQPVEMQRPK